MIQTFKDTFKKLEGLESRGDIYLKGGISLIGNAKVVAARDEFVEVVYGNRNGSMSIAYSAIAAHTFAWNQTRGEYHEGNNVNSSKPLDLDGNGAPTLPGDAIDDKPDGKINALDNMVSSARRGFFG